MGAAGQGRIHKKPNAMKSRPAVRGWTQRSIVVRPEVIVLMGATAAQALLGRQFRVTQQRGQAMPFRDGVEIVATVHPSSILRAPDEDARHHEMGLFVADLRVVAGLVKARNVA